MEEHSLLWRDTNSDCDIGAWQRRMKMRMSMNMWRTLLTFNSGYNKERREKAPAGSNLLEAGRRLGKQKHYAKMLRRN
jgi:hypothetical protein